MSFNVLNPYKNIIPIHMTKYSSYDKNRMFYDIETLFKRGYSEQEARSYIYGKVEDMYLISEADACIAFYYGLTSTRPQKTEINLGINSGMITDNIETNKPTKTEGRTLCSRFLWQTKHL